MGDLASNRKPKTPQTSAFSVAAHDSTVGRSFTGVHSPQHPSSQGIPDAVFAPAHAILSAAASTSPLSAHGPAYYESLFGGGNGKAVAQVTASNTTGVPGATGGARGALYYETSTSPVRVSALSPPPSGHAAAMLVPVTQRGLVSAAFTAVQQAEHQRQQETLTQGWQGSNNVITAVQHRPMSAGGRHPVAAGKAAAKAGFGQAVSATGRAQSPGSTSYTAASRRNTSDSQCSGSAPSLSSRHRSASRSPGGSPRAVRPEVPLPSVAALAAAHGRAADSGAVSAAAVASLANALDALMQVRPYHTHNGATLLLGTPVCHCNLHDRQLHCTVTDFGWSQCCLAVG
jgi:hypothetical protein